LPEQVAAVEALAFIMHEAPSVLTLEDQHLLAFLSEFLKMSSIADGEMTDSNLFGYVVDRNGYAMPSQQVVSNHPGQQSFLGHSMSVFLRRECLMRCENGKAFIAIPEELPEGVLLRVSALRLFRSVIKSSTDAFFDSEASTPVGKFFE
jgi:hypothetical protein